ncbi:MAG: (d)CMP kinase [Clostridiales bacterium]|nr:(d)CMP kinase [Clostridiales bacterium]
MNIAIDGPSGAGKSTIAKILAKELNITYLDTGAMYRALGLKAYQSGISPSDEAAVSELIDKTTIDVQAGENGSIVFLDGRDVSAEIRQHHISKMASDISALQCVRIYMVDLQRKIAARRDSVLDGRDIGTVVLKDAEFKFYLTASVEVRAHRRYIELMARGEQCDEAQIQEDIARRDYNDMHRQHSPLKKADDAIEIDSTSLTIQEVKDKMLDIIKAAK